MSWLLIEMYFHSLKTPSPTIGQLGTWDKLQQLNISTYEVKILVPSTYLYTHLFEFSESWGDFFIQDLKGRIKIMYVTQLN